ncbi:MAG: dihydrolipoamide acetyltransferase family protein, partial [Phycisphaerales bacterium]
MSREFRLPDLGEGVVEGQILRVFIGEGDLVKEDQPLLEVETDKASVEIPSPHTGIVSGVHITEQQIVNVGDLLVTFDGGNEAKSHDVEVKPTVATTITTKPVSRGTQTKPASPAVRKLARELGIDLQTVNGSGPGGRVTRADLEASGGTAERAPASSPVELASASSAAPVSKDNDNWGPITREPLTRARKAIADAMVRSVSTIPHATDSDDADVTDLDKFRRGYRSDDKPDRKLSILPFVIRATAMALQKHPIFN